MYARHITNVIELYESIIYLFEQSIIAMWN